MMIKKGLLFILAIVAVTTMNIMLLGQSPEPASFNTCEEYRIILGSLLV